MGTVDLNDRLNNALFNTLHAVEFFVEDAPCFLRVDRFKVIVFPLHIHHNGKSALCVTAFLRGYLM